ncbi:MAG: TlpA family protein disulfide reductase [Streptosporangiaceae bacterium]
MLTGAIVLVAVLVAAGTFGMFWNRRNGRMRGGHSAAGKGQAGDGAALTESQLGGPLGGRATLVQFSTAFCAPCRATRVILADVAKQVDGVTHVEIDAESHLDLVRTLDIRRTPTVLVLGPDGRIAQRASGQPRKAEVIAAIGAI